MKLERLCINALPGVRPGFSIEGLPTGVTVITGPNGVGKSSIVRAVSLLLEEPRLEDPRELSLEAVFEGETGRLRVSRLGREVVWERQGQRVAPEFPPDGDRLRCYLLSMEELLSVDGKDDAVSREIRRSLMGGYDLQRIGEERVFSVSRQVGRKERTSLFSAERTLKAVEDQYEELQKKREDLPRLEQEIRGEREIASNVPRLEKARELLRAREELRLIEETAASQPKDMGLLRGDEAARLQALEAKRDRARSELADQRAKLGASAERVETTRLAATRPDREDLVAIARSLERVRGRMEARAQERRKLDRAKVEEDVALASLGQRERAPRLDPTSLAEAETLAAELQQATRRRDELSQDLREEVSTADPSRLGRHSQAITALRDWLLHAGGSRRDLRLGLAVACLASIGAALLALLVSAPAPAILALFALTAAAWVLVELGASSKAARRRFEETGIEPPPAWERDAVENHISMLENTLALMQHEADRARLAEEKRGELKRYEEQVSGLEARRDEMAKRLGFDPGLTAAGIDRFARLVAGYERAKSDGDSAKAAIARLDTEIGGILRAASTFVSRWSCSTLEAGTVAQRFTEERKEESSEASFGESSSGEGGHEPWVEIESLESQLRSLDARLREVETAELEVNEASRAIQRLERELSEADEELESLFRGVGLEPKDATELARRLSAFEEWRLLSDELRDARVIERRLASELEGYEELLTRVAERDSLGLERDLEDAKGATDRLSALLDLLGGVKESLRLAGEDVPLERAIAEVKKAESAFEERQDETLFAEAAKFLLEDVRDEFRVEHEPEVLRNARELFRRFTHGSYDLRADDDAGLMAFDMVEEARRSFLELSSATRMQLLVATRLAWMRHLERGGEPWPVFLDEALTTTDEQRFAKVAGSLDMVSGEDGRQVIYLTSRRQELAMWEGATGRRPHHLDLSSIRFGREEASPALYEIDPTDEVPSPAGCEPESYAATLGVPLLDPWAPRGSIHLFHLLRDDLDLLYSLLKDWRVSTLGQLESLLAIDAPGLFDDERRTMLEARCKAARAWVQAWRQGRGIPLDRHAIARSEIVSSRFIDKVVALAERERGDAAAVVAALRDGDVARFRAGVTDELAEWLEAEGYIDGLARLDRDERRRLTLLHALDEPGDESLPDLIDWLESGAFRAAS